jgi:hypothetical protein
MTQDVVTNTTEPGGSRCTLHVLNGSGDTRVSWDRVRLAAGDPEAQAAVAEAERIFARARASGAQAFRLQPNAPAERLTAFDANATEVVLIPPMVGG